MSKSIPKDIKTEVLEIVSSFNEKNKTTFEMTFRGRFAYLSKTKRQPSMSNMFQRLLSQKLGIDLNNLPKQDTPKIETKLGRLRYNGQMDNWDFAVFKYSREKYDPEEWMFPGYSKLNGTIEGTLNAGLELY